VKTVWLDPIKLAHNKPVILVAGPTTYAELGVTSPAVANTISSTHCTNPQRDGQAEWA